MDCSRLIFGYNQHVMNEKSIYSSCKLCPNLCGVDRTNGERGRCEMSDKVRIAWSGLHRGEEPPLVGEKGSGMVFFTGCPLHCAYCQNRQISGSDGSNLGIGISDGELSALFLDLERMGARTLNLVTGTHFIPSIVNALENAFSKGFKLPVVWNSSGYESCEALALIDKYIDLYLLDCKSLSRNVSKVYCGLGRYADVIIPVMDWIKERHPSTDLDNIKGTILRHLVFPGTVNHSKKFISYFASRYKDNFYLSLMSQFVPPKGDKDLLPISDEEYQELVDLVEDEGIENGFIQEKSDDDILWIPDFREDCPFPHPFADPSPYFLSLKRERVRA